MRNIFISFLGTGNYQPIRYGTIDSDSEHSLFTEFVQSATLLLKCSHFGESDKAYVLCTPKAKAKHWDNLVNECSRNGTVTPTCVDITMPVTEADMWTLFSQIGELVGSGDRLTVDITHSFRFLPMLMTVEIQYLKIVKKIELAGIYYGAFDAAVPGTLGDSVAPLIDLAPFLTLYDWSAAIHLFQESGDSRRLASITQESIQPLLRDSRGRDKNASALRTIIKTLQTFTDAVAVARGRDLIGLHPKKASQKSKFVGVDYQQGLQEPLSAVEQDVLPPLRPVIEKLKQEFEQYSDGEVRNGFLAAQWAAAHGQLQAAFTLLQECIITAVLAQQPSIAEHITKERAQREFISSTLSLAARKTLELGTGLIEEFRELASQIADHYSELSQAYDRISNLRNDLNHAGFREDQASVDDFRKAFDSLLRETSSALKFELPGT